MLFEKIPVEQLSCRSSILFPSRQWKDISEIRCRDDVFTIVASDGEVWQSIKSGSKIDKLIKETEDEELL